MYSYKNTVKTAIKGWMEDYREELVGLDKSEVYDVVYDACWVADEVTGNASGSYTFSRYEARRNFFQDEDSDEYISQMIEYGFITTEEVGEKVSESNWEWIDVSIRCWLLSQCLSEVLDEMYKD